MKRTLKHPCPPIIFSGIIESFGIWAEHDSDSDMEAILKCQTDIVVIQTFEIFDSELTRDLLVWVTRMLHAGEVWHGVQTEKTQDLKGRL